MEGGAYPIDGGLQLASHQNGVPASSCCRRAHCCSGCSWGWRSCWSCRSYCWRPAVPVIQLPFGLDWHFRTKAWIVSVNAAFKREVLL